MWVRNFINYMAAIFKTIMSYAEIMFNVYGRGKNWYMGVSMYVHVYELVWINESIL
jgi:hypothetical protein